MTIRAINWPKLIGTFVVALGIAFSLKLAEFVFDISNGDAFGPVRGYLWPVALAVVGSVISIIVGLAAYSARKWARFALVGITVVSIVLCVIYAYMGVTRNVSALGTLEPQYLFWCRLLFFGEAVRAVSPPVFFLLVLLHPDVVRSFQPAVEPTI